MLAESPVLRAYIHPPESITFNSQNGGHFALSPDGQMLAFVGRDSTGRTNLWVRPMRSLTAQQLPGTAGANYPFWSPDNKQIAFFADGKLKRIDAAGGPALTICDAPNGRGGTWNSAGVILFAPENSSGLSKVSAAGGAPTVVTRPDTSRKEQNHRFPTFLPNGDHFLYMTQTGSGGPSEQDEIVAGSLSDSSYRNALLHASSNMAVARGHLVYFQQKTLMARPFDSEAIRFVGDAMPIAEDVLYGQARSKASFSASVTGILLYQAEFTSHTRMTIVDRTGREVQSFFHRTLRGPGRLSKDGRIIAYGQEDLQKGTADIWLYDIGRAISTRFTFDAASEQDPVWSPDGASIVYSWFKGGHYDLYVKSANGTDTAQVLYSSGFNKFPANWSADGQYISFTSLGSARTKADLYLLPLSGDRKPIDVLKTEFNEALGKFSPDGRWISYFSDASGRGEVYIRPFPNSGAQWQVSKSGGGASYWRGDGKELYFVASNRKVMSVEITAKGNMLEIGREQALFDLDARGPASLFDVTGDGTSFLVSVAPAAQVQPITMVTNWDAEVKKK